MDEATAAHLNQSMRNGLWRSGNLRDWYLKPKQKAVLEFLRRTEDPFFEASRRYGKTTTVLAYCIEECLQRNGIIVRWCEPWKNQCREIVSTEFIQILAKLPINSRFVWHQTDSYYEYPKTGSRIYLRGVNEDRGESARGTKAHIVVADELGTWREPEYVLTEVLKPQLLTTSGKLILTGTPPRNMIHAFYKLKDQAKLNKRYIQRLIHDQELVSWEKVEKFVSEMGGWESQAVRRELLCEKVIDSNFAIIPEWDDRYIVDTPTDEFFPYYLKYDSLDIAVRDLTVLLLGYYDFKRAKLVIMDEVVMNGASMTTEKLANAGRSKEAQYFGVKWETFTKDGALRYRMIAPANFKIRRVSDIDLLLVNDLSTLHGLYFEPTDKGYLEEMVNEVRLWVGGGKVEVNPRCTTLIDSLRYGLWDEDRKQWERSEHLGHFDALAALMYMIRNVDSRTNPIPLHHGKPTEDYYFTQEERSKTRDKFKKMLNVK